MIDFGPITMQLRRADALLACRAIERAQRMVREASGLYELPDNADTRCIQNALNYFHNILTENDHDEN